MNIRVLSSPPISQLCHWVKGTKLFLYFLLLLLFMCGFIYKFDKGYFVSKTRNVFSKPHPNKTDIINERLAQLRLRLYRSTPNDAAVIMTGRKKNFHKTPRNKTPGCPIPQLVPYHNSVPLRRFLTSINKLSELGDCKKKYPLLFKSTLNSSILPVQEYDFFQRAGYQSCCYRSVERDSISSRVEYKEIISSECFPLSLKNETIIPEAHEFIAIYCRRPGKQSKEVMMDVHAFIPLKPTSENGEGVERQKFNVVIFGLDSISRMNMIRTMPRSYSFLKRGMEAVEMTGYNKVEESTFPILVPMLTSKTPEELRCMSSEAKSFDKCPFIWKEYSSAGFYTSLSEDATRISIFNYHKPGFKIPPTDYYLRPIAHLADDLIRGKGACYGPRLTLQFLLDYVEKFVHRMSQEKKNFFQFTWATELTHTDMNSAIIGDMHLLSTLKWLKHSGYLNDTIFILMSDHGERLTEFRNTIQGLLEDRLPFMFFVLPDSFKKKYNRAYQNLIGNGDKLITTFDMYDTLMDILNPKSIEGPSLVKREVELSSLGKTLTRGISLFLPIPDFRTCKMAGIKKKYCACMDMKVANITDPNVNDAAKTGVSHINSLLSTKEQCAPLELEKVIMAQHVTSPGSDYLVGYVILFETRPGGAQFEAWLSRKAEAGWEVQVPVDRINSYGTESHCVEDGGLLKFYCYCKDLVHTTPEP